MEPIEFFLQLIDNKLSEEKEQGFSFEKAILDVHSWLVCQWAMDRISDMSGLYSLQSYTRQRAEIIYQA